MSTSINLEMSENMRSRSKQAADPTPQNVDPYSRQQTTPSSHMDPYFNTSGFLQSHAHPPTPHLSHLDEDGYRTGATARHNTPPLHTFVDLGNSSNDKERRPRSNSTMKSSVPKKIFCAICCLNCFCFRSLKGFLIFLLIISMVSSLTFIFYHEQIRSQYDAFSVDNLKASMSSTIGSLSALPPKGLTEVKEVPVSNAPITHEDVKEGAAVQNLPETKVEDQVKINPDKNTKNKSAEKQKPKKKVKKPIKKNIKKKLPSIRKIKKKSGPSIRKKIRSIKKKVLPKKNKNLKKKKTLPKKTKKPSALERIENVEKEVVESIKQETPPEATTTTAPPVVVAPPPPQEKFNLDQEVNSIKLDQEDDQQGVEAKLAHFTKKASELTDVEIYDAIRQNYKAHGHMQHMFEELNQDEKDRIAEYIHNNQKSITDIINEHHEDVQKLKQQEKKDLDQKSREEALKQWNKEKEATTTATTTVAPKTKTPFNKILLKPRVPGKTPFNELISLIAPDEKKKEQKKKIVKNVKNEKKNNKKK
ncbi:rpoA2 [Acrasis kona]|uniref:RpoA2 n=1 Tax=Acrasis kona TaxID=1008807 RepID=A0AAW2Z5A1_9EUKA